MYNINQQSKSLYIGKLKMVHNSKIIGYNWIFKILNECLAIFDPISKNYVSPIIL